MPKPSEEAEGQQEATYSNVVELLFITVLLLSLICVGVKQCQLLKCAVRGRARVHQLKCRATTRKAANALLKHALKEAKLEVASLSNSSVFQSAALECVHRVLEQVE
jgi:hypothetical protein